MSPGHLPVYTKEFQPSVYPHNHKNASLYHQVHLVSDELDEEDVAAAARSEALGRPGEEGHPVVGRVGHLHVPLDVGRDVREVGQRRQGETF